MRLLHIHFPMESFVTAFGVTMAILASVPTLARGQMLASPRGGVTEASLQNAQARTAVPVVETLPAASSSTSLPTAVTCPCLVQPSDLVNVGPDGYYQFPNGTLSSEAVIKMHGPKNTVYPSDYGLACDTHDAGLKPCCDAPDLATRPSWCASRWCYVNPATCMFCQDNGVVISEDAEYCKRSKYGMQGLWYSYGACNTSGIFEGSAAAQELKSASMRSRRSLMTSSAQAALAEVPTSTNTHVSSNLSTQNTASSNTLPAAAPGITSGGSMLRGSYPMFATCSDVRHDDPQGCLDFTRLGARQCSWCAVSSSCSQIGSLLDNAWCTNQCCATPVGISDCDHSTVEEIPANCNDPYRENTDAYSEEKAIRMQLLSAAAYNIATDATTWSCGCPCDNVKDFNLVKVVYDASSQLQAFVGIDTSEGSPVRVVSFRGTINSDEDGGEDLTNWYTNLDTVTTKPFSGTAAGYPGDISDVIVHQGFYNAYMTLQQDILDALSSEESEAPISITGHSLGAAMAVLAAFDLAKQGFEVLDVITFGAPRVGQRQFAYLFKLGVKNYWRVTHGRDPVPHVPPEAINFRHAPTEVFYPGGGTTYTKCEQSSDSTDDLNCSNQCSSSDPYCTVVGDHSIASYISDTCA